MPCAEFFIALEASAFNYSSVWNKRVDRLPACGSLARNMEPTYNVIGSDGKQYGPISTAQLRDWTREGRIIAETRVQRSDMTDWVTASSLPELGLASAPTVAAIPAGAAPQFQPAMSGVGDPELERRVKSGAGWFYWIAAFVVINTILIASKSSVSFALGLGITAVADHFAQEGMFPAMVAFVVSGLAAGVLALFGFFASKGHAWAFIVGMLVLAADSVLVGVLQMWISLIIHLFALFSIFSGFKASRAMRQAV